MTLRSRLALPVFGAGVLSAVAYAPDAVVDALRRGSQQGAIPFMALGVVGIMLLLALAYRSNLHARPDALGDYGLVRDVLGRRAGVVTGAAVLVDYLFTVAVSVAAITQARGLRHSRVAGLGCAAGRHPARTHHARRAARRARACARVVVCVVRVPRRHRDHAGLRACPPAHRG
ncbi:hypothetical protein [Demequina litorisediminis]|uniref:hypothetical protein n=1 Tax=Demequina litorisediminis TaxID=1849022 RepID=UPI0024E046F5|nr:hypothetical protein [Demequina litorisediminis]